MSGRLSSVVASILVCAFVCGGCSEAPASEADEDAGTITSCVGEPIETSDGKIESPLAGVVQSLLWSREIPCSALQQGLTLHGSTVALVAGNVLALIKGKDAPIQTVFGAFYEALGGHVVDETGRIFFVGDRLYSVDSEGRPGWSTGFVGDGDVDPRAYSRSAPLISSTGDILAASLGGYTYSFESDSGAIRWKFRASSEYWASVSLDGGVADTLFYVGSESGRAKSAMLDVASGRLRGETVSDGKVMHFSAGVPGHGILSRVLVMPATGRWSLAEGKLLDWCGQEKWSLEADSNLSLVGFGGQLIGVSRELDGVRDPQRVVVYDVNGEKVAGPTEAGMPLAIGADGTIYSVQCDSNDQQAPAVLVASSASLERLWDLNLGGPCLYGPAVMSDDGVMYLAREKVHGGVELLAIQTTSPGLAPTAWPTWRRDNRGSAWLK